MAKKPQFKRWVSPIGIFKWAFIDNPSKPFKEGDDPKYKVTVLIEDTPENRKWCEKVVETAQKEAKEHKVKLKKVFHNPFIMPEDVDEEMFEPQDGNDPKYDDDYRDKIIFNATSKFQPGRIDTQKNSLPEDVKIFSDDVGRIKFEASPFVSGANTGVTLRLLTAQLVEKNASFGGGGVDTDGFDDIDGYVAETPEDDDDEEF